MTPPQILEQPFTARGLRTKPIDRLVVHAMTAVVGTRTAWEHLEATGLSVHALIAPDGLIIRGCPSDRVAYHARGFNATTLGVEVLVPYATDYAGLAAACGWDATAWKAVVPLPPDPYTPAQYSSLVWWLRDEAARCPSRPELCRHSDLSPERKFDPGPVFDWARVSAEYHAAGR